MALRAFPASQGSLTNSRLSGIAMSGIAAKQYPESSLFGDALRRPYITDPGSSSAPEMQSIIRGPGRGALSRPVGRDEKTYSCT